MSPCEGRLLRLTPGSIVYVAGTSLEITGRFVYDTPQGQLLQYRCRGPNDESDLWIAAIPIRISWCYNGHERELLPEEIESF